MRNDNDSSVLNWLLGTTALRSCVRGTPFFRISGSALLGLTVAGAAMAPTSASAANFSCASGASGEWTLAGTWTSCNSTYPNNGAFTYDATVSGGNSVTLTGTDGAITIGNATVNASGNLYLDPGFGQGGASLTLTGTLTNNNTVWIGTNNNNLSSNDSLTAANVVNNGTIDLFGNTANTAQASLVVHSAAPSALTGTYNLTGDSAVIYDSGTISSIGTPTAAGNVTLNGTKALIANAGSPTTNSALATLGTLDKNSSLTVQSGVSITTNPSTDLTIAAGTHQAGLFVDDGFANGGSHVTIGGTLTNNNTVWIGTNNSNLSSNDSVTAANVVNNGTIDLFGNTGNTAQASLVVHSAAPSALTGTYNLTGDSAVIYDSGTISSIGTPTAAGNVTLNGTKALIANAGSPTTNSALATLGTLDKNSSLTVQSGVSITTNPSTDLTIAAGTQQAGLFVDDGFANGGSQVTIGGTLTNNNTVWIGTNNSNLSSNDSVTAANLVNNGTIDLFGNTGNTAQASLVVHSAAPSALTGTYNLTGDSAVIYDSGTISSIGTPTAAGNVTLNGAKALIANAGSPTTNSALATLGTLDKNSSFTVQNGVSITTNPSTGLTIAAGTQQAGLFVDNGFANGGSQVTIGGTLTQQQHRLDRHEQQQPQLQRFGDRGQCRQQRDDRPLRQYRQHRAGFARGAFGRAIGADRDLQPDRRQRGHL